MTPSDIARQVEAALAYEGRGGCRRRWLRSKGFTPRDLRAIRAGLAKARRRT